MWSSCVLHCVLSPEWCQMFGTWLSNYDQGIGEQGETTCRFLIRIWGQCKGSGVCCCCMTMQFGRDLAAAVSVLSPFILQCHSHNFCWRANKTELTKLKHWGFALHSSLPKLLATFSHCKENTEIQTFSVQKDSTALFGGERGKQENPK